jgi:hypothetical protein
MRPTCADATAEKARSKWALSSRPSLTAGLAKMRSADGCVTGAMGSRCEGSDHGEAFTDYQ